MTLGKIPFEDIVGKGENADYQHFSSFPTIFIYPFNLLLHIYSFKHIEEKIFRNT